MKKIIYIASFIALAFASCDPLSKTYSALDALPQTQTVTIATVYATPAAALAAIPAVLNTGYGQLGNNSTLTVNFPLAANTQIAPDVTLAHIAYTVVTSDYAYAGGTFTDFSVAQAAAFLTYKYPTPAPNQLSVLTYTYFESGFTPSAGIATTDTFMYLAGAWTKIYTVTADQYASVSNRSLTNTFASADLANISGYLNIFLKSDPSVSLIAKAGDIKYVSYRYTNTLQEAVPMMFDGTNWNLRSSLIFVKSNGVWIPDPSIYYKLTTADTKLIATSTFGTAAQRTNLGSYGDFSGWATADVQGGIIVVLTADFPTPKVNVPYKVTYLNYTGGADVPTQLVFLYTGGAWITQ